MEKRVIHLDHHEETPLCAPALEGFKRSLEETVPVDSHIQIVRDLVGASEDDPFVFTSSGVEAVNQVLWSVYLEVARKGGKCHFLSSSMESPSTLQMFQRLEELGCFVKFAPTGSETGEIDVDRLQELIGPRTALISVPIAHGASGVIQPIEEIARIAKQRGVLLHLDADVSVGKIYFSFSELGADYLTFSGELIHGPKHSGALFARKSAPLVSLIGAGPSLRGGPFDLPSFMAFSIAAGQAALSLERMCLEIARLRNLFETEVIRAIPTATVLFQRSLRLPNTSLIDFPRTHNEALLYLLSRKNLHATLGPSSSTLNFSFSRMNSESDVHSAVSTLKETVQTLHALSQEL